MSFQKKYALSGFKGGDKEKKKRNVPVLMA